MSKVVSVRLKDNQFGRLQKIARKTGHTPSTTAARLIEEALRMEEFPLIEFRDGTEGRQAYLRGTRFKVWLTVLLFRNSNSDIPTMAKSWRLREIDLTEILGYAQAYPEEIEPKIAEAEAWEEKASRGQIPDLGVIDMPG